MITVTTIRRRLRRMYNRERAAYKRHKKEFHDTCFSGCEDARKWWAAQALLTEAIEAAGGRAPKAEP